MKTQKTLMFNKHHHPKFHNLYIDVLEFASIQAILVIIYIKIPDVMLFTIRHIYIYIFLKK